MITARLVGESKECPPGFARREADRERSRSRSATCHLARALALLLLGCTQRPTDVVCEEVDDGAPCPTLAAAQEHFADQLYCSSGAPQETVVEVTGFDHRDNTVSCPGGKDMCWGGTVLPYDDCCYLAKVKPLDANCGYVEDGRPRSMRVTRAR